MAPTTLVLFEACETPLQRSEAVDPAPALPAGEFVRFELQPKDAVVNLRLPQSLLAALRARSKETGIPSQRLIRIAVERMLGEMASSADAPHHKPGTQRE